MFAFFHFMDTCNISISYLAIFEMFSIAVDCLASKLSDYSWSLVERQRTVLWDMIRWSWKAKKTPAPTRKPNQIITNTHKKKNKTAKTYTNKQNMNVERSRSMCKTDKSKEPRELQERKICRMSQFRFYF